MKPVRIVMMLLLLVAAFAAGLGYGRRYAKPRESAAGMSKDGRKILYWVDPMHPSYKSDKPGIAPDCGMQLEPVYADEPAAGMPMGERKILHYRDPEDHSYTSDKPGLNPETGNDLEPVYEEVPGRPDTVFRVSPERQQLVGVRYGVVEMAATADSFRTVGRVTIDETRVVRVHTRVDGWIEKVFVDFTGRAVRKGEQLLSLYSPELLASQREYLLALRAKNVLQTATLPSAIENSQTLLEASRRRLELWSMTQEQIDQIARTGQPLTHISVESPISGHVLSRNAFPGQRITPENELYVLADLSRVWIMADVFEFDAPNVRLGQHAAITLPYAGGRTIHGRVTYIQPRIEAETRTLQVRLEAPNPGLALKPEMYVDVEFHMPGRRQLMVPAEAVLDTGERKTVFVDLGDGYLDARAVETGERAGDRIAIRSGLKAGERIVVSGNFLIDSEAQLKSAIGGMGAPAGHAQHGLGEQETKKAEPKKAAPPQVHQHD